MRIIFAIIVFCVAGFGQPIPPPGGGGGSVGPTGPTGAAGVLASNSEFSTSQTMTSADCPSSLKTFTGSSALTYTLIAPIAQCAIGIQNNTTQTLTVNLTTNSLVGNAGSTANVTVLACGIPSGGCPVSIIKANGTSNWDISNPGATGATGPQGPTGTVGSPLGALIASTGAQSVANNTQTALVLANVVEDDGGYSGTANTLTVPSGKAGWYAVTAGQCWSAAAQGGSYLQLALNGSAWPYNNLGIVQQGSTVGSCVTGSAVLHLAVGDAISINGYYFNSGGALTSATAFLSMAYIN